MCDSLKTMQQALHKLGKVAPLDIYMKIVREQKISNVKVVINVAQGIPDQPTYGNMIVKHYLLTPSSLTQECHATRAMVAFMYFCMHNVLIHKPLTQQAGCELFKCQFSSFRRTASGRKQLLLPEPEEVSSRSHQHQMKDTQPVSGWSQDG